jgi:hypothetical protein
MRESSGARAAFNVYLALGPARSLARLHQTIGKPSVRRLETWSAAHRWQERVRAHERAVMLEAERQAEQERVDELAKRRAALRALGGELQRHGLAAVRRAAAAGTITPSQAVALIRLGADLLYRSVGEPETAAPNLGIDLHVDVRQLSDDELDERLAKLRLLIGPHRGA